MAPGLGEKGSGLAQTGAIFSINFAYLGGGGSLFLITFCPIASKHVDGWVEEEEEEEEGEGGAPFLFLPLSLPPTTSATV